MAYTVTNTFATQSGNVPASQLDTNFSNVLSGVNNAFLVGVLSARPAPDGIGNGRYYFATDVSGGTLYRDNGSAWVAVSPGVNSGTVAIVPNTLINVGISATVSGNNLTITLTDGSGSTITASNPAYIAFPNATLTTGFPSQITLTSAPSLTISNTVTLGTTNGVQYRLYIVAMNNAGTVELAIFNTQAANSLVGLNETSLYSSSTPGNSAQTLYSTTARTSLPIRVLGYIEITEATAGTWATAPTVVRIMGPGMKRTGDLLQVKQATTTTQTINDTSTYADSTLTVTITVGNACNAVRVFVSQILQESTNLSGVNAQIVRGSTSLIVFAGGILAATASTNQLATGVYVDYPQAAGATTYKTQFAHATNNARSIAQPGTNISYILVEEIFA